MSSRTEAQQDALFDVFSECPVVPTCYRDTWCPNSSSLWCHVSLFF